ncbi:MAG: universal stress protein [Nitrospira sp.]|nr:universal stress protein [Nitrospira sp.]
MKVLLAVEQTRISVGAIRLLTKLTLPSRSDLILLHVNAVPQKITGLAKERILKISQQVQEVQKKVSEQARQFLSKIEKTLRRQDVVFHPQVKIGFPGEEILKTIHSKGIDLVVLGTRSYSQAAGFFLGSVSQWVLQEAPCSVVIARNRPHKKLKDRRMKVLLATDGSPDSGAAVDFINMMGFPASSEVMILHVIKKQVYETERALMTGRENEKEFAKLAEELFEARGQQGANLLEQTSKRLSSPDLTIQKRLVYGNAANEILKAARLMKADLIVVGSQGSTGVKRMFLGSVSNKVVHSAGCSVAVIRHKEKK